MIAVSNTTPLRYLIAINQQHLLEQLFDKVIVPAGVYEELTDPRTPDDIRHCVLSKPSWLEVRSVLDDSSTFPLALHRGEREAILLAQIMRCDVILIDEQAGRTVALARNLPVSGTLGVMEQADTKGLIDDFPRFLESLIRAGFFVHPSLKEKLLERHRNRRLL